MRVDDFLSGRNEVERSEGLLSLPGCGRVLCVVRCESFTRPSTVDTQIKNPCIFLLLKIELSYLKQCFRYT